MSRGSEVLLFSFYGLVAGIALGAAVVTASTANDCDKLNAVVIYGQAYTCFKELTEEDDK